MCTRVLSLNLSSDLGKVHEFKPSLPMNVHVCPHAGSEIWRSVHISCTIVQASLGVAAISFWCQCADR